MTTKALKLMALNDARIIGKLKQDVRDGQKREREVFTCLRDCCEHYGNFSGECYYSKCVEKSYKCTMRNCPLLAKQKKE